MTFEERALQAQQALFDRYDQLNDRITKAEQRLTSFHVPQTVTCEYDSVCNSPDPDDGWVSYFIAVAKVKGTWRLCHAVGVDSRDDLDFKPLVDCSAWERVRATKHLHKLEDALIETSKRFVSYVDRAVAEIDNYLAST